MNYKETIDFLFNSFPVFDREGASAYKPGLERTVEFNEYLNSPDSNFLTIHVAGTNGKGSVSHILASILQSAGYRVGLFTSPHLKDFRERIKVNNEMISEQKVVNFVAEHKSKMDSMSLSFFEMNVGIAFDHFRESSVEVAIIETGLGGRLDATNIIKPILSVITNIGLDHVSLLGNTVELIAKEKAGIIKSRTPVLIGEEDSITSDVFKAKALEMGSKILFANSLYSIIDNDTQHGVNKFVLECKYDNTQLSISLDLMGEYQSNNILTALGAIHLLNTDTSLNISKAAILDGSKNAAQKTGLNGRWQILSDSPLTVCDTGHNEQGLKYVCNQIQNQKFENLYMVIGFVNDKELKKILPILPQRAHYIFTQANIERALPASELAEQAKAHKLEGEIVVSIKDAISRAKELASDRDMIFIGGSTFTVAEI